MGFNYLQTDDRDDYLSQFGNNKVKKQTTITLINPIGETIFVEERMGKVRQYAKKNYIPFGTGAKRIWRKVLESKGYKVITVKH